MYMRFSNKKIMHLNSIILCFAISVASKRIERHFYFHYILFICFYEFNTRTNLINNKYNYNVFLRISISLFKI